MCVLAKICEGNIFVVITFRKTSRAETFRHANGWEGGRRVKGGSKRPAELGC